MNTDRCDYSDLPRESCEHCPPEVRQAAEVAAREANRCSVGPNTTDAIPGRESAILWSGKDAFDAPMPDLPGRARIKRQSRCRHVPAYGYYLPEHEATCKDRECIGCKPCEPKTTEGIPLDHCAGHNCTEHVAAGMLNCPRCIGRTRDDLTAIEQLAALMIHEAIADGIETEAANLAGPALDPIKAHWQRVDMLRADHSLIELPDEDSHPLTVLGRWELMLREDYEQDYSDLPPITIAGARAYLSGILDRLAQDREQDWPLFASEIRACRTHLEAALHDSRTPEKGAPCPSCPEEPKPPALVKHYVIWDHSGAHDYWRCPTCGARWLDAEYRLWVGEDYLAYAEALTASEIADVHGIKPSAIRKQAERDPEIKRGKNGSGQMLYDVERVLATTRTAPETKGA